MLNAQEILEKKFEKSAFGYRSDEVDDYLQELSAAFDKLQNEKIQMERKLEVLAEKIEEYRADEDNMRAAILDARKLGSSIVKDAQRQADEIIADANAQSAKVIDSIQTRAEREKMNLSHLQKEVATFKNQLLALYKNHQFSAGKYQARRIGAFRPERKSFRRAGSISKRGKNAGFRRRNHFYSGRVCCP